MGYTLLLSGGLTKAPNGLHRQIYNSLLSGYIISEIIRNPENQLTR